MGAISQAWVQIHIIYYDLIQYGYLIWNRHLVEPLCRPSVDVGVNGGDFFFEITRYNSDTHNARTLKPL